MTHLKVNSTSNLFYSACEESIHLLDLILSNMLAIAHASVLYIGSLLCVSLITSTIDRVP